MSMVTKTEKVVVERSRQARVSDFSGVEIPQLHWSAVTNIHCYTSDHGQFNGNKGDIFRMDLMPEEMNEFLKDLQSLVARHKRHWASRIAK